MANEQLTQAQAFEMIGKFTASIWKGAFDELRNTGASPDDAHRAAGTITDQVIQHFIREIRDAFRDGLSHGFDQALARVVQQQTKGTKGS